MEDGNDAKADDEEFGGFGIVINGHSLVSKVHHRMVSPKIKLRLNELCEERNLYHCPCNIRLTEIFTFCSCLLMRCVT